MKKLKLFFFLLLFLAFHVIQSQDYDTNWILGDWFEGNGHNIISFSSQPPIISVKDIKMYFGPVILSASDSKGKLIFYSNGLDIRNKNDNILMNSDYFNYSDYPEYREYMVDSWKCDAGENAMKFIAIPNEDNQFIIFHVSFARDTFNLFSSLYFTIIDMDGDNQLGEVIKKNILLRQNVDGVALTKHANGKDWWLGTSDYLTNEYILYLIDSTGISEPINKKIGPEIDYFSKFKKDILISSLKFSSNGSILIRNKSSIGIFVLDFDRATGNLEFKHFNENYATSHLAFSPNSQNVYFDRSFDQRIAQYNIIDNKLNPASFFYQSYYGLAPDNRVYFSCGPFVTSSSYLNFMCYINRPDLPGLACDPHINAIKLPKQYSFGIPQYPNYRLGRMEDYNEKEKIDIEYIYKFGSDINSINKKYTYRLFEEKKKTVLIKLYGTKDDFIPLIQAEKKFNRISKTWPLNEENNKQLKSILNE